MAVRTTAMLPKAQRTSEAGMAGQERWEEIWRLYFERRMGLSQIARELELDRKTVRRCLRQSSWQPYRREVPAETLLSAHKDFLRERAAQRTFRTSQT
jgi:hypothetical protein